MIALMIDKATRVLGKSQGYLGLPVRDEIQENGTAIMVSSWEPTPLELERLNAGASVKIQLMGRQHPPIRVDVDAAS